MTPDLRAAASVGPDGRQVMPRSARRSQNAPCHGVIAGVERLECQQLDVGAPPVDRPHLSLGLHPRPDDQCRLRVGAGQVP